ncbi:hypothetical protein [Terasakiella sp.]|uniref:hypothetical protein n=1 Tax=Terasakiella sp. TaxID=2034861 RepID=UPI003AA98BCB
MEKYEVNILLLGMLFSALFYFLFDSSYDDISIFYFIFTSAAFIFFIIRNLYFILLVLLIISLSFLVYFLFGLFFSFIFSVIFCLFVSLLYNGFFDIGKKLAAFLLSICFPLFSYYKNDYLVIFNNGFELSVVFILVFLAYFVISD